MYNKLLKKDLTAKNDTFLIKYVSMTGKRALNFTDHFLQEIQKY